MAEQFVSKFNIGDQTIEVKDASARTTASTASTNASNALNKVLELVIILAEFLTRIQWRKTVCFYLT